MNAIPVIIREHAYAIWIVGQTIFAVAGAIALAVIIRDVTAAWPRIVATLKGEEHEN
jgi:hypothetical protein